MSEKQTPDLGRSYTREQFRARNGNISEQQYLGLRRRGLAPQEFHPPNTTIFLISARAELEWQEMMAELALSEEAELERQRRRAQSHRAAARSIASVKHIRHVKQRGPYNKTKQRDAVA
jgi:hypothetical protein